LQVLGLGAPKLRLAFEDVEGFLWKATEALKTENFLPGLGFMLSTPEQPKVLVAKFYM
jgi:hypothetical protein